MGRGYNNATCLEGALKTANYEDSDDDYNDGDVDDLRQTDQSPMAVWWLFIWQVKELTELTYMQSEGIQVSFETEILEEL